MNIAFVGGGVMAEAMLQGILREGVAHAQEVWVGEPVEGRRRALAERHGVAVTSDNLEAVQHGDLVVLSVKPQNLPEVLGELQGKLNGRQALLSIVAGARMRALTEGLSHAHVIRVMPNTPAQVGAGMSLWLAAPSVSETFRTITRKVLGTLGDELEVAEEKLLDMATALSASGPAYVFLFLEGLIAAGVYLGMTREMARRLALQTVLGSVRLAQETGKHPAELRDMVTSPGGTTAEALRVLEQRGFRSAVLDAVVAAYDKARKLGEQR
ncbi:MAG: pyrroline-5-carboxylate reductase [Chloroflexi bacterium]|nr:pyrroline-5-carboxylate reductase [Chloroflexota bacterium]